MTLFTVLSGALTLVLAVNPISGLPLILGTLGRSEDPEHERALRAIAFTVFGGCLVASIGGFALLSVFGISAPAFLIGTGALLAVTGMEKFKLAGMSGIQQDAPNPQTQPRAPMAAPTSRTSLNAVAVSPIGIPILIGPGAITMASMNGQVYGPGPMGMSINLALAAAAGLTVYICYRSANRLRVYIERWRSPIFALIGLILICRGAESIIHGIASVR
jgi:multiple antibiotic resistance protein